MRAGAARLAELGATVDDVSIPMHAAGQAIFMPIAAEGATQLMMHGNGFGTGHEGLYLLSMYDAISAWRDRADELSETLKIFILIGQTALLRYGPRFYAKCSNLRRQLRDAYDETLGSYDLLLMPTLPITATPIPGPDAPREEIVGRGLEMLANTQHFDITGHPAMSIPCGSSEGLPIGLMLVGKHHDESTIYRVAHAFEQAVDWQA